MSQIFHPSTNTISRLTIFGALAAIGFVLWVVVMINRSGYVTGADVPRDQPIQFSHFHHVGGMGLDCRYCHTSVEEAAFAGIPPTRTCMNCHSQIFADAPILEPVRTSFETGRPLRWVRVHDLPDFVYFDHSIHVRKGIGCSTCHGRVDLMPLARQTASLQMEWCLECHRAPERFVRPRDRVFDMTYQPPADQIALGRRLVKQYGIADPRHLTSCSVCHR